MDKNKLEKKIQERKPSGLKIALGEFRV